MTKRDSSPACDLASQLEKLAEMKAQGLLSDEVRGGEN